ncbi:MAG: DUF433 domain-containing protein [Chloracidobacterium sp.]|nr:DUF433 domain-containing protein [Chloracidobacterium sp.]
MAEKKKIKHTGKRGSAKIGRTVARSSKKVRNYELPVIVEDLGGKSYEYIELGKYIVAARGVCGGRPTIKYRRLDARWILAFYENGDSMSMLAKWYKIPIAAVKEVIALADEYDYETRYI